jgi:hypothetical protein
MRERQIGSLQVQRKRRLERKDYFFPKAYRVTEYYYSQATQNKTKQNRMIVDSQGTGRHLFIAVSLTVHSLLALRMRGEEDEG